MIPWTSIIHHRVNVKKNWELYKTEHNRKWVTAEYVHYDCHRSRKKKRITWDRSRFLKTHVESVNYSWWITKIVINFRSNWRVSDQRTRVIVSLKNNQGLENKDCRWDVLSVGIERERNREFYVFVGIWVNDELRWHFLGSKRWEWRPSDSSISGHGGVVGVFNGAAGY